MASAGVVGAVRFGAFRFDLATRELRKHGIRLRVADQPLEILAMLIAEPGKVVTRGAIRARLWPHGTVVEFEHSVNAAIKRLRDALADSAATPSYIETLPRKGYRFIAPVESDSSVPGIRNYRILGELGRGGMGVVYRATDVRLGRDVAIKVLPPEFASDPQRRARLMREARAASALNHPNIVTVYEVGSDAGADFIAMEFVVGKPLTALIPPSGMPSAQVVKLATQIADGLAKAHSAGIVHRDLKPGNIMVADEGLVKLLDFGLAKVTDAPTPPEAPTRTAHATTTEGAVMGTTGYMSPEQAEGRPVDARSDIFAFGVVLYEMLSGQPAFQKDSYAPTVAAVLTQNPAPLPPSVPAPLERTVARCLQKDPDRRFQTMVDVRVELQAVKEEFESGKPATATQAVPRKHRLRLWASAASLLSLVSIGALSWRFLWYAPVELKPIPLTTYDGAETTPTFSPDGHKIAFTWTGESDDEPHIYLKQIGATGPPVRLTRRPEAEGDPAWSPDDRWIAFVRFLKEGTAIVIAPPVSGIERTVYVGGVGQLSWTADSKWLVHCDVNRDAVASLWAVSIDTGERHRLTDPQVNGKPGLAAPGFALGDFHPSVSPDGRTLAFARETDSFNVELWAVPIDKDAKPTAPPARVTPARYPFLFGATWTVDSRDIVYSAGDLRYLWRVPVSGRRAPRLLPFAAPSALWPTVSGRAARLAYTWRVRDTNIWRLDTGNGARKLLIGSTYDDRYPQYSPDGSRIAFQSNRSGAGEVWTCTSEGTECSQLTYFNGPIGGSPTWSPDGHMLALDSRPQGQSEIYVMSAAGGTPRRMTNDAAEDQQPSWSHDGRWIYFTSDRSGRWEVWRMPAGGGKALQITRTGAGRAFESPDAKSVIYARGGRLFRTSVDGGPEQRLVAQAVTGFAVANAGVYYVGDDRTTVRLLDASTGTIRLVATLDKAAWEIAASPNGRYVVWAQTDKEINDLMLVENFH